ncbi:hypothetical protein yberc0001_8810 [Yersinia bercovieri ATCC 43970]|uniref:Uncharacterized protein n=1 Tax=Yersinia bercovieri ATCC 43970 TaxID=349968 RepID=A0ABP2E4Y4_YERBE|nr:hypothetical protein yberc0001_8810 [Yersinia bercovieri ATCC 43970]
MKVYAPFEGHTFEFDGLFNRLKIERKLILNRLNRVLIEPVSPLSTAAE